MYMAPLGGDMLSPPPPPPLPAPTHVISPPSPAPPVMTAMLPLAPSAPIWVAPPPPPPVVAMFFHAQQRLWQLVAGVLCMALLIVGIIALSAHPVIVADAPSSPFVISSACLPATPTAGTHPVKQHPTTLPMRLLLP